jgi:hypothetical protein
MRRAFLNSVSLDAGIDRKLFAKLALADARRAAWRAAVRFAERRFDEESSDASMPVILGVTDMGDAVEVADAASTRRRPVARVPAMERATARAGTSLSVFQYHMRTVSRAGDTEQRVIAAALAAPDAVVAALAVPDALARRRFERSALERSKQPRQHRAMRRVAATATMSQYPLPASMLTHTTVRSPLASLVATTVHSSATKLSLIRPTAAPSSSWPPPAYASSARTSAARAAAEPRPIDGATPLSASRR